MGLWENDICKRHDAMGVGKVKTIEQGEVGKKQQTQFPSRGINHASCNSQPEEVSNYPDALPSRPSSLSRLTAYIT
jgi:hypothetical protein